MLKLWAVVALWAACASARTGPSSPRQSISPVTGPIACLEADGEEVRTHACTHIHTRGGTRVGAHASTHARAHARTHARAHARTHARMHVHARERTHAATRTPASLNAGLQ